MKVQTPHRGTASTPATEPALVREAIGSIAVLTLNRPRTRNSLSEAMLAALHDQLASLAA